LNKKWYRYWFSFMMQYVTIIKSEFEQNIKSKKAARRPPFYIY